MVKKKLILREIDEDDLPVFFLQQRDPDARHMAAFVPKSPHDEEAFMKRWKKILADDSVIKRTIDVDGEVIGMISCFEREGTPEVTYWLGKEHWGKGFATRALKLLLDLVPKRPLYARTAKDNRASVRVLEKGGFSLAGEEKAFANARDKEIDEWIYKLEPDRD
ncbi:MAG TPA: GNAT family N-acetyltransferase [Acidobacteriota bacterium]|nr:GNAT family N-acetyltransferase [Acidobacteriota bacterium]